jgi:hypothetical protein
MVCPKSNIRARVKSVTGQFAAEMQHHICPAYGYFMYKIPKIKENLTI